MWSTTRYPEKQGRMTGIFEDSENLEFMRLISVDF